MSAKNIFAAMILMLLQPAYAAGGNLHVTSARIEQKKPTYTIELSYPRTGQAAIDREIESWAQGLAHEFAEGAKDQGPGQIGPWSAELSYEVQRNDARMFSVLFTYYTFSGGAHPNSNFEAFNFVMPDATHVELADLFTRAGIERISAISIAQLSRDLAGPDGMTDTDWIKKGAGPNPRNFAHFVLQPRELVIHFDAYQVAAYAAGPQEVHIPLAKLNVMLRPDPRVPAASFDCARAQSDVERAVCGDRDLARLDRHVAEGYFDKLAWEGEEAKRFALRKDQRAWLMERDGCRVRAESFTGCLARVYQARLKVLEGAP